MEFIWWTLILATMVVYPVFLVRSALKGKRWARETLEAMRYLGGDMMTTSAWRSLPPEREPPEPEQQPEVEEGRLVA